MIRSEPAEIAPDKNPPSQKRPKGLGVLLKKLFEEEENMSHQTLSSLTPREQVDREIKNYLEKPSLTLIVILCSGGLIRKMNSQLLPP